MVLYSVTCCGTDWCVEANTVREEEAQTAGDQDQDQDLDYSMFHIRSGPSEPYRAVVKTNGNPLSMEIDTGASVSVVGEETFETIQKGDEILELQKTSVLLQTYTGEAITVLGSTLIPVEHNGQMPLIVTAGNGPPLLGRDSPLPGLEDDFLRWDDPLSPASARQAQ